VTQQSNTLDWRQWVERFDRMQARYLIARRARFDTIVRVVGAVRPAPERVLDLGCGTGSLSEAILEEFPGCMLVGVDVDQSLLALAANRLGRFGKRVSLICADLRTESWMPSAGGGFDAAISATALHWLSSENLALLYRRLAKVLKPGGLFINADHVASDCPAVQEAWQQDKARRLTVEDHGNADTWPEFWQAYAAALGVEEKSIGSWTIKNWEAVEDGMPMAWHFDRLRESGFTDVDCFWRCYGDAIYGGVKHVDEQS